MGSNTRKILFGGVCLAFVLFATPALAQAPAPDPRCPTGYTPIGAICLDEASGDVVNQLPTTQGMAVQSMQPCESGYELIQSVCISTASGDVQLPLLALPTTLPK